MVEDDDARDEVPRGPRVVVCAHQDHPLAEEGPLERDAAVEGAHREGHRHADLGGGGGGGGWGLGVVVLLLLLGGCCCWGWWVVLKCQSRWRGPARTGRWSTGQDKSTPSIPSSFLPCLGLLDGRALALDAADREGQEPARAVGPEEEGLVGRDVAPEHSAPHDDAHALDLVDPVDGDVDGGRVGVRRGEALVEPRGAAEAGDEGAEEVHALSFGVWQGRGGRCRWFMSQWTARGIDGRAWLRGAVYVVVLVSPGR